VKGGRSRTDLPKPFRRRTRWRGRKTKKTRQLMEWRWPPKHPSRAQVWKKKSAIKKRGPTARPKGGPISEKEGESREKGGSGRRQLRPQGGRQGRPGRLLLSCRERTGGEKGRAEKRPPAGKLRRSGKKTPFSNCGKMGGRGCKKKA